MITRTQFIDAGDQTGIVSEKALHRVRRGIPANNIYIPPTARLAAITMDRCSQHQEKRFTGGGYAVKMKHAHIHTGRNQKHRSKGRTQRKGLRPAMDIFPDEVNPLLQSPTFVQSGTHAESRQQIIKPGQRGHNGLMTM